MGFAWTWALVALLAIARVSGSSPEGRVEIVRLAAHDSPPAFRIGPEGALLASSDVKQLCASLDGSVAPPFARDRHGVRVASMDVLATPEQRRATVLCVLVSGVDASASEQEWRIPTMWQRVASPLRVVDTPTEERSRATLAAPDVDAHAAADALAAAGVHAAVRAGGDRVLLSPPGAAKSIALIVADTAHARFLASLAALAEAPRSPKPLTFIHLVLPVLEECTVAHARDTIVVRVLPGDKRAVFGTAQTAPLSAQRRLTVNTSSAYTSSEIEDFQLFLWVSLGLVATLAAVVCTLLNMDSRRDPILYSQFKSSGHTKRD